VRAEEELIDRIVNSSRVPSGKRRREIQRELRCHIEDFVVAAREAGRDQDEIEKLVLANFGDPGQIARGFSLGLPARTAKAPGLRIYAFDRAAASSLLAAILATQAGLAFGFGTPVMKVLASRHTVIEALDILASVAVYLGLTSLENLFQRHRFQKPQFCSRGDPHYPHRVVRRSGFAHNLSYLDSSTDFSFGQFSYLSLRRSRVLASSWFVFCWPDSFWLCFGRRFHRLPSRTTCISWLVMGVGYQLMTDLAARVDAALLNGLQRIQAR
jgi:hypothetical protein